MQEKHESGQEAGVFYEWRFADKGVLNPEFEMNAPRYQNASILLTRSNFGCGSSREHAAWTLLDFGLRTIIAPSFADIFHNNCFKNGLLPIRLSEEVIDDLFDRVRATEGYELTIDLASKELSDNNGLIAHLEIEPHRQESLLLGLDDMALILTHERAIDEFEINLESEVV